MQVGVFSDKVVSDRGRIVYCFLGSDENGI
jgi:hypothetical protein